MSLTASSTSSHTLPFFLSTAGWPMHSAGPGTESNPWFGTDTLAHRRPSAGCVLASERATGRTVTSDRLERVELEAEAILREIIERMLMMVRDGC